jgi:hypothetical protein
MTTPTAKVTGLLLAALLAAAAPGAAAAAEAAQGLRFNSPGVLDLAERSLHIDDGAPVTAAELSDADAERIFAAPAIGEDPPLLRFSDDVFGCAKPSRRCSLQHEHALIAAAGAAVTRSGERLELTAANGTKAAFADWKQPATKSADGDEETHWYLGRLPGSDAYDRVEVQFGHDAPGNFLVNRKTGKVAFVHNGADLVVPNADATLLLTWNALNGPLSLRVAALDAAGPRLVFTCSAPEGADALTPVFKGWSAPARFDFVIEIGAPSKSQRRLALSVEETGGAWRFAGGSAAMLAKTGFACEAAHAMH